MILRQAQQVVTTVCYIVVRGYAVNDQESAEECIKENKILRNIARHCVDETEGLFITLPEDSLIIKTFIESCTKSGIEAVAIDPTLAQIMEPSVNPDLVGPLWCQMVQSILSV